MIARQPPCSSGHVRLSVKRRIGFLAIMQDGRKLRGCARAEGRTIRRCFGRFGVWYFATRKRQ